MLFWSKRSKEEDMKQVKLLFAFVNVKRIYLKEQNEQCSEKTNMGDVKSLLISK